LKTIILLLFIGTSGLAQVPPGFIFNGGPSNARPKLAETDRFRQIDGKYYDLKLFYDWLNGSQLTQKPFKDWDRWNVATVSQVLTNGLLVEYRKFDLQTGDYLPAVLFLKDLPNWTNRVDGDTVSFIAKRCGEFHYVDVRGTVRTVPFYDYGVPVVPQVRSHIQPPAGTN
jgi:hypothetical protein